MQTLLPFINLISLSAKIDYLIVIYFDSVTSQAKSNTHRTYSLWRKSHLQICFIPNKQTFIPSSLFLGSKLCCLLHLLADICKGLLLDSLKDTASEMLPEFLSILLEISKVADTHVKLKIYSEKLIFRNIGYYIKLHTLIISWLVKMLPCFFKF